ncbi:hypothetical protein H5410_014831 [Solanum commersonii]|uniref:SWIM-type domain-containing protein n=1 Tax=Solanum commersonii TaxID=4109 RepID=A0A9J5ZSM1_SOLCO|nr:hypothetical protein H5410_014831 [Solanum commersonii]
MMVDNNFTESFNAWILEARAKPIIKIYTVNLEQKKCTCRIWDLLGIPCPHAIKALTHKKVDPITEMHWWYSKEAYILTYKNKMQLVRGQKFWKVDPSSAMLPPDVVKQLGRPKRRGIENQMKQ